MEQALEIAIDVEPMVPEQFEMFWPMISRDLQKVPHLWNERWTLEYIFHATMSGMLTCWGAGTNRRMTIIFFTRIIEYPVGNHLNVFLLYGQNFKFLAQPIRMALEMFAQEHGCVRIEGILRDGMARYLVPSGVKPQGRLVTYDVREGRMH